MKIICVDDEELVLDLVVYMCNNLPNVSTVRGFTDPLKAIEEQKSEPADIALLDIDMPVMNGITLAVKLKDIHPDTAVIFLTGYSNYALEAFRVHANGYLLKPLDKERLVEEIGYAMEKKGVKKYPDFFAKTFGDFDFLAHGSPVSFSRQKSKELLAFLIDKRGSGVTRAAAFAALYEDEIYDRRRQKQFDVIVRSLRDTLEECGAKHLLVIKSGELRINPGLLECDLYRLLDGDARAVNAYRGEYMSAYPWASITEAFLDRNTKK